MKTILVIGATSAIACACTRIWASRGEQLVLVARDLDRLEALAADLTVRGAVKVDCVQLDLNDLERHELVLNRVFADYPCIDVSLIAVGVLPEQQACSLDASLAAQQFQTNAVSVMAMLTSLVPRLSLQGHGAIGVITSVAGDRGRPSNFYYGSAKAALSVFCAGLRASVFKQGLTVTDIRPGFVATPMTAGLLLPRKLVSSPDQVAVDIVRAVERGQSVCYTPGYWRAIMWVIRQIPDFIFKRLNL